MTTEIYNTFFSNVGCLVSEEVQVIRSIQFLDNFRFNDAIDFVQQLASNKARIRRFIARIKCLMMSNNVRFFEVVK